MTRVFRPQVGAWGRSLLKLHILQKFGWAQKAVGSVEKLPHKTLQLSHTSHSLYDDLR
jgi:hypothetical protein